MAAFPIDLSITPEKKLLFKTSDQLRKWCDRELENWLPLSGIQMQFHHNIYAEIQSPIQRLKEALAKFESAPEPNNFENELRGWMQNLSQMIQNSQYIYSDSLLGRHIRKAAEKDRVLSAAAYFMAVQPQTANLTFNKLTATASSFIALYYMGVAPETAQAAVKTVEESAASIDANNLKIEALHTETNKRLDELENQTAGRLSRVFKLVGSQLRSKRSLYDKRRDETVKDLREFVGLQIGKAKESISQFEEFTKDKVSLQGPIHYWESKMKVHRTAAVISGLAFLLYCGAVYYYTKDYIHASYGGLNQFLNTWRSATISAVGLLGAILAVFLIFARVIYRIFSSQLHLWNDCAERVTMTETYLSLAERGHAREELLGALFSRLFAPSSDGIVRDDLGAVSPLEALGKGLSGKP